MPLGSIPSTTPTHTKKLELSVVTDVCNPSTWEAEIGGSQLRDQPQQLSEALRKLVRPCFQRKIKIQLEL